MIETQQIVMSYESDKDFLSYRINDEVFADAAVADTA